MAQNDSKLKLSMDENPFPNEHIDPKIKESDDFGIKVAKAILYRDRYYSYVSNRIEKINENRRYATGRQDVDKYKPQFDPTFDAKNGQSLSNMDWSIEPICPKIINQVIGNMINQDHKIQLNSIDPYAKTEFEEVRDRYYGNVIRNRELLALEQMAGTKLFPTIEGAPESKEEVDMYMQMDYRVPIEIAMEEIVDFELYKNDWNDIKHKVIRDLVENNKGIVRRYWDQNNDIRLRWVDIIDYITSDTKDDKHMDVEYQAELYNMTIREVRKMASDRVSEEELFRIAKQSAGKYDNPKWTFGNYYSEGYGYNDSQYAYDDYRVQVLDFVFYSTDTKVYEKKDKKGGGFYMNPKSLDYKAPKNSKSFKKRLDDQYRVAYTGIWAIDTDIMINYGREKNMVRPEGSAADRDNDPRLINNFIVIEPNIRNGESMSMVDYMRPTLDEMQLLVLKMRHIVAEAAPPGIAIDVSALNNLDLGDSKVTPKEVIAMWKQKGIMLYDGEDDSGNQMNRKPIEELVNGVQGALQPLVQQWLFKLEALRLVTGMNDAVDGSTPDKDALVGIQKMRVLASNNATRETYKAFLSILEGVGKALVPMIKMKIQHFDGWKEYQNVIGSEGVRSIDMTPERIRLSNLGIKVEALPNDEDIERLNMEIQRSLDQKEIRLEDAIEIRRVMNPKKAEQYLIYRRKQYRKEALEEMRAKEEITMQREQQAAMAAAQAEQLKEQARTQREQAVQQQEYDLKMQLSDRDTMNKIKEIDREYYWKERLVEEAEDPNTDSGIDANQDGKAKPDTAGGPGVPRPISKPRIFSHPDKSAKRVD